MSIPDPQKVHEAAARADVAAAQARAAAAVAEEAARSARSLATDQERALRGEPSLDEEILSSLWLHVPWRSLTRHLSTEERERWADVVDENGARMDQEEGRPPEPRAERWWRGDFVDTTPH